ncbi:transcriptional regulator [Stratiformator vulcanicus]
MHEKARLGILTSLVTQPNGVVFSDLKEHCDLTDGNLSRHLATLESAGLIEIWKSTSGGRSQTRVSLTESGREQFLSYLSELERVIADAAPTTQLSRARLADT